MQRINAITSYPINAWETAVKNRPEIEFEQFNLVNGLVSQAHGFIIVNDRKYRVNWLNDGRCYHQARRANKHDIIF